MDEQTTPVPEAGPEPVADLQPETPPVAGGGEKLLPQSEVNRLVANARREGFERAQKKPVAASAPSTPVAPAATGNDALAQMQSQIEEMGMRLKFTPLAIKAGLDDSQAEDMFDLFKLQRPQDPAGWLTDKAQRFGIGRKSDAATPPPQVPTPTPVQTATPVPARPNVSDRGTASPVDSRDSEGVLHSRPLEMTAHDVDALILKHGHDKGLQMFQERVLSALRGVRIKPRG